MNRMGKEFLDNESGVAAVIFAGALVVFCGFAALAIDYGQIVSVRRELTKAAEAGALSGARRLWPLDLSAATNRTPTWSTGETWAKTTAAKNLPTNTDGVPTDVVTVEVGKWDYSTATKDHDPFTVDHFNPNGVRVTIRRDNVPTIFAKILPILLRTAPQPINIERSATAIMDFAITAATIPITVNFNFAKTWPNPLEIIFSPDMSDDAGWFNWGTSNPNAAQLVSQINKVGSGDDSAPVMKVGDLIQLDNGGVTSALQALENQWNANKLPDGSWTVSIPVVAPTVTKFVGETTIISFVTLKITNVNAPPYLIPGDNTKRIEGTIVGLGETPGLPGPGTPGGTPTGTLAPPRLVQ